MITFIHNANIDDIVNSAQYLINKSKNDLNLRALAESIVYNSGDYPIRAIFNWTRTNFQYLDDPTYAETFISPIKVVEQFNSELPIGGDCDDHALLNTSLLLSIGITARMVIIDQSGYDWNHAYTEAWNNTEWIVVDTTTDYPFGWVLPYKRILIV